MSLFRPDVERLAGYVPGEQPQESGWVKLNTNENPYSPSPSVLEAVHAAASGRLNVYPDPLASAYRKAVADVAGVDPACREYGHDCVSVASQRLSEVISR